MIKLPIATVMVISFSFMMERMLLAMPPMHPMPKASSQKSLNQINKRKKGYHLVPPIILLSTADQTDLNDLLLATAMRYSGSEKPLMREFKKMIKNMASLPEVEKWQYLQAMKEFDEIAQNSPNEQSDAKLTKIRQKMNSIHYNSVQDPIPESKMQHKRGVSY
jgi:hypothetical protein